MNSTNINRSMSVLSWLRKAGVVAVFTGVVCYGLYAQNVGMKMIGRNAENIKMNADNIKMNADNIKVNAASLKVNAEMIKAQGDQLRILNSNADKMDEILRRLPPAKE